MGFYRECPYCHENLDPGEHHECIPDKPEEEVPMVVQVNAAPTKVAAKSVYERRPRYTRGSRPERRIFNPDLPCFW